jgi:hypothetical protein
MHGTGDMTQWRPIESRQTAQYEGYLSSRRRADDEKLAALAKIRERSHRICFASD